MFSDIAKVKAKIKTPNQRQKPQFMGKMKKNIIIALANSSTSQGQGKIVFSRNIKKNIEIKETIVKITILVALSLSSTKVTFFNFKFLTDLGT